MKRCFWIILFLPLLASAHGVRSHVKSGVVLHSNDLLPTILTQDAFGNPVNSDSLRGKKLLITFNRYVSCPLCNLHTHELLQVYDSLKKMNVLLISFYESSPAQLLKYVSQEEIPFVMISDSSHTYYERFGVGHSSTAVFKALFHQLHQKHKKGSAFFKGEYERDGELSQLTADFLVNDKGRIERAYYARYIGDHLPLSEILKWASSR